jgi:hypothetical protein
MEEYMIKYQSVTMGQIYGIELGRVMNENMTQDVISLFRSGVLREQKCTFKEKKT